MVSRFLSRWIALALLLAIVASPMAARGTVAQDAATPCPVLTEEDVTAFATVYIAAWNTHDAEVIAALHAPDALFHWGIGVDAEGRDEIQATIERFLAAFPDLRLTLNNAWLAGDGVALHYTSTGTQEIDFLGVPASQTTATWTGINVMQVSCGLIVEHWGEADHFGRITQQGVIPVASPTA